MPDYSITKDENGKYVIIPIGDWIEESAYKFLVEFLTDLGYPMKKSVKFDA